MSPEPSDPDAVVPATPGGVFPGLASKNDEIPASPIGLAEAQALQDQQTSAAVVPLATSITGIITEAQFRAVIQALEQRNGVSVLSFPSVSTESGRQVQICSSRQGTASESNEGGIAIDVIPEVLTDGRAIKLILFASLDHPTSPRDPSIPGAQNSSQPGDSASAPPGGPVPGLVPLPRFTRKPVVNTATVTHGQTVVMIGTMPSSTSEPAAPPTRRLRLIAVTPILVDPADHPVRAEDGEPASGLASGAKMAKDAPQ
ncbi:MAG TPA: hypothetical protein P5186_08040 [Candidatus Paceibacterota bacterium]|nr:hypothetical protein [Verrucomicrobiota bacterium]HRY47980.1 hypothetical protein [Candidatus Paceibacterota bacterium]